MNKRTMFMIGAVSAALITSAAAADAKPTTHNVYVDGTKVNCAAYAINGNNYFKLRDLAAMVNGTDKQFEVTWNEAAKRIDLTSAKAYTTVGGEMGAVSAGTKNAKESTATVYKDGSKATYTGYNIAENNYYKLRDVAKAFNIGIKWDEATQRVDVLTTSGYEDESQTDSGKTDDANTGNTGTAQTPSTPSSSSDDMKLEHLTERPSNPPTLDPTNPARDNKYWYMPADEDLPADGEYSQQYLDYLNNCDEKILDLDIRFHMYGYKNGKHDIPNTRLEVWVTPKGQKGVDHYIFVGYLVTTDENGNGRFKLKVPESVYNMMLSDQIYNTYFLDHNGPVYSDDGLAFKAVAIINNYMLQGYNGDLQIQYKY